MSTSPHSDDLDRTDELPQLDVAAYEAAHGLDTDPLSTTDTWLVGTFPDPEAAETQVRGRSPAAATGSVDLSINVDRLLQRVATVESELAVAREAQLESEAAARQANSERTELTARIASLEAANAHLREQQSLSQELTERLQQQLHGQVENHKTQLAQLTAVREADRSAAEQQRLSLEQQIESSTANYTSLADEHARLREQHSLAQDFTQRLQQQLHDQVETLKTQLAHLEAAREADRSAAEQQRLSFVHQLDSSTASYTSLADEHARLRQALEESRELAGSRARQIDDLQHAVIEESGKAHALARNLAAKLADYDIVSSMVSQRNSAIAALEGMRDELTAQLERAFADSRSLAVQLDETNQRATTGERLATEIAARDAQLAQLGSQIETWQREQQEWIATRERLEVALREAGIRAGADQERQRALQAEIGELRTAKAALTAERDHLQAIGVELEAKSTELAQVSTELANVKRDALAVWAELEAQSRTSATRQQELEAARQAFEEQQRSREALQLALQDAQHKIERLHAVSADDTQLLNERTTELASLRNELETLAGTIRGLEHSLHARNTLIEDLRTEIRTVQDERAIMSEQLSKARSRVKSMSQQILNRDSRIATLMAESAVHIEALASIRRDVDGIGSPAVQPVQEQVERWLEPVNHEAEPILLNRKVMTMGRTSDNDIFIPSKMVSRHHARLLIGPNAVIIEDAGSTNGSFVNDQQIKQHVLHEDDVLTIGDLKFRLRVHAATPGRSDNVVQFKEGRRHDD